MNKPQGSGLVGVNGAPIASAQKITWRRRTATLDDWPVEIGYTTEIVDIYVKELNAALDTGGPAVAAFVDRWEAVFRTPYLRGQDGYSWAEYQLLQREVDWAEITKCCLDNKIEDAVPCKHMRFMQSVGIIDQPRCPSMELLSPGVMLMAMSISNRFKAPIGAALIRLCESLGAVPEQKTAAEA